MKFNIEVKTPTLKKMHRGVVIEDDGFDAFLFMEKEGYDKMPFDTKNSDHTMTITLDEEDEEELADYEIKWFKEIMDDVDSDDKLYSASCFVGIMEEFEKHERAALFYLTNFSSIKTPEALTMVEDVMLFNGTGLEYVRHLVENDSGDQNSFVYNYFDEHSALEQLSSDGAIIEFEFEGNNYTCINAQEV